jgi:hypothetical protein
MPPPHAALTETQSTVAAAEAKGAQQVPEASLYLKMAKDGVQSAQGLMNEDKNRRAAAVLQRARLDAELAASLATEDQAKQQAQQQLDRVKSLEQTNNARLAAPSPQS